MRLQFRHMAHGDPPYSSHNTQCVLWLVTQLTLVLLICHTIHLLICHTTRYILNRTTTKDSMLRQPHSLVFMRLSCWRVVFGLPVTVFEHNGTLQATFWISEPMHTFLTSSGIEREQVLSRVRYEPKPQVFVQADHGLQSNSFFTETVSKIINFILLSQY